MGINDENMVLQKPFNWKIIIYIGLLAILCVCSFLLAEYIVRNSIDNDDVPIDTSVRM